MEGYTNFTNVHADVVHGTTIVGSVSENVQVIATTAAGVAILPTTTYVSVTSDASTKIVILPAPVVGKQLIINVGATGFNLKPSAATIGINGGTPGASAVSAIAANSTCYLVCVSATSWKGFFLDADGDLAKIPQSA